MVLTGKTGTIPDDVLPTRKFSSGAKPSITTAEALGPLSRDPLKSKFDPPLRRPNDEEGRHILKEVVREGIMTVMSSHTYMWNGDYKLQLKGGGIGDKLAQAAARLYMIWWDKQFIVLLASANITVTFFKRYVDDGNVVCPLTIVY